MNGMKRIALGATVLVTLITLAPLDGAQAIPYSDNDRIGANLSPVRTCFIGSDAAITSYTVVLRNRTRYGAYFRSYEVMNGGKVVSEHKEWKRVPPHSTREIEFVVADGEASTVVVTFRDEVLTARRLRGVCFP